MRSSARITVAVAADVTKNRRPVSPACRQACVALHCHAVTSDGIEALRQELSRVALASAAEPWCRSCVVLEAVRPPVTFVIHWSWLDEASFNHHGCLAHTAQFLDAASALVTHAIKGWRLRETVGITHHVDDDETARQAR